MRASPWLLPFAFAVLGSSVDCSAPDGRELKDYSSHFLKAGDGHAARAAEDLKRSNAVRVTFLGATE